MASMVEILVGIAGSGKSTYAHRKENENAATVISRDRIRRELLNEKDLSNYWKHDMDKFLEEEVTKIEHHDFAEALAAGDYIIIDNTNLRKQYIQQYISIMIDFGLTSDDVEVIRFDIDPEEAYKRVQLRDDIPMAKEVIYKQYDLYTSPWNLEQLWEKVALNHTERAWYFPPFYVEPYKPNKNLPQAILCDLDGTLSHRSVLQFPHPHMRSYYDTKEYDTDYADRFIKTILASFMKDKSAPHIIFVTGRKSETLTDTLKFLRNTFPEFSLGVDYDLYSRDENIDYHDGKHDPDDRVKYRLFNKYIRDKYDVLGVFDDRKRVVALWQALGIRTADMGLLNEEF